MLSVSFSFTWLFFCSWLEDRLKYEMLDLNPNSNSYYILPLVSVKNAMMVMRKMGKNWKFSEGLI